MKKIFTMIGAMLLSLSTFAAMNVEKIDPPFWYAGMKNPELQLMIYGPGIGDARVSVDYPGVNVSSIVKLESENYLLLYLHLDSDVKPGTMQLNFTLGKKKFTQPYELKTRAKKGCEHMGFDASDALYLLMPDRFANGKPENDNLPGMQDYKVDRNDPNARHGGDLAGIEQHLDYFSDLGITALWFTPVLENNMQGGSYHGYATTDYYRVDPRFGTNEEYCQLISAAHKRGIKMVMDLIFNHCGVDHRWIKDMPSKDWFNNHDYQNHFVQTSFKLTSHVDPYTSKYDFDQMNDGWFVSAMPDLNQKNPHVMRYLIQNSFWWIEYADIDGIRMDTYPYADYDGMSRWMAELNEEYPNYNTVGETWVTEPAYTAWWQKDSKLSAPKNSNLKTVMDFSFYDKINIAKNEQTETWFKGLDPIYNNFVYDFLYPNPASVLAFIENHDTDRFLGKGKDSTALKQALAILLTVNRIPQLYYGTEVLMNGTKEITDGNVRKDFPGGFPGDEVNKFTRDGRTRAENAMFDWLSRILHWRQGNETITKGAQTQFIPYKGVYVIARTLNGNTVLTILNGKRSEALFDVARYAEVIGNRTTATDITTGNKVDITAPVTLAPRQTMILDIK